jgi:hypothetical protein
MDVMEWGPGEMEDPRGDELTPRMAWSLARIDPMPSSKFVGGFRFDTGSRSPMTVASWLTGGSRIETGPRDPMAFSSHRPDPIEADG